MNYWWGKCNRWVESVFCSLPGQTQSTSTHDRQKCARMSDIIDDGQQHSGSTSLKWAPTRSTLVNSLPSCRTSLHPATWTNSSPKQCHYFFYWYELNKYINVRKWICVDYHEDKNENDGNLDYWSTRNEKQYMHRKRKPFDSSSILFRYAIFRSHLKADCSDVHLTCRENNSRKITIIWYSLYRARQWEKLDVINRT